jgi:hypothetical protein
MGRSLRRMSVGVFVFVAVIVAAGVRTLLLRRC